MHLSAQRVDSLVALGRVLGVIVRAASDLADQNPGVVAQPVSVHRAGRRIFATFSLSGFGPYPFAGWDRYIPDKRSTTAERIGPAVSTISAPKIHNP